MEQSHLDPYTGDDLRNLYHGTFPQRRARITQLGLLPGSGLSNEGMLGDHPDGSPIEAGIFLTTSLEEARDYGDLVYRVDITGLDYLFLDGPDGYHYVVIAAEGIAPERLHEVDAADS